MIVDHLRNASMYYGVNPRLEKAFKFLLETDLVNIKAGSYELDGTDVIALVQEYKTEKLEEAKWECHKHHLDVQYLVSGVEKIGYSHIDGWTPREQYNEEYDYTILNSGKGDFITLQGDTIAILTPDDAHVPRVADTEPMDVKKICIKVLM